jgi:hypothetical protein
MDLNDVFMNWSCGVSENKSCDFDVNYSEGSSYKGYLAIDDFKFKSELDIKNKNFKHIFGCALIETGLFRG